MTSNSPVLKTSILFVLIGLTGVAYVWLVYLTPWNMRPAPPESPAPIESPVPLGSSDTLSDDKIPSVTGATFDEEVLGSRIPVLVDFYADWCGPYKQLAPILADVAREIHTAKIVKVNVDDSERLADRYGISGVPTLILFKDGQVIAKEAGLVSKNRLKAMLDL